MLNVSEASTIKWNVYEKLGKASMALHNNWYTWLQEKILKLEY